MIREAVILAGGFGTRLKSALPDKPKCLAPSGKHAFIDLLITYLHNQGIERFIFSLGYKSKIVIEHLEQHEAASQMIFVEEQDPLGTGGAVLNCLSQVHGSDICVVNGDSLFDINLSILWERHQSQNSECTLAAKWLEDTGRYGRIGIDPTSGRIVEFAEKQAGSGFINGGIYILNKERFWNTMKDQTIFSFEKDYLEKYYKERTFCAQSFTGPFIDIGIPEDYKKLTKAATGSAKKKPDNAPTNFWEGTLGLLETIFSILD